MTFSFLLGVGNPEKNIETSNADEVQECILAEMDKSPVNLYFIITLLHAEFMKRFFFFSIL